MDIPVCANCDNEGWVCENHPEVPWGDGDGCCGGAGSPCKCNNYNPPWDHPGHGVRMDKDFFIKEGIEPYETLLMRDSKGTWSGPYYEEIKAQVMKRCSNPECACTLIIPDRKDFTS